MKNAIYLFALAFICLISSSANAQYEVGFRVGNTKAWQNYGDVETPDEADIHIKGEQMSVFVYKKLGKRTSLGIEPSYTVKGARCVPGFEFPFEGDTKFFLQYFEAPVFVKYMLPLIKEKVNLYGKSGYGFSFLNRAFREDQFFDTTRPPELEEVRLGKPFHEDGRFNRFEHSLYSGLGLSYDINRSNIFIEGNYTFGLSNAERVLDSNNRVISWGLGYKYSLAM